MTTRREVLVMIGVAPLGVSMGVSVGASGTPSARAMQADALVARDVAFIPDRELRLTVSDNLQRQTWLYAGQRYTETGKAIIINENEQLRLILVNDTDRAHSLLLDGMRIDVAANESRSFDFIIDQLHAITISHPLAAVARIMKVRPSYQTHAVLTA
jgi:FtsP/CotA-like multicopper oxidase with cupredoxin domain